MPTAQLHHHAPQAERNPQVPGCPQLSGADREPAEGGGGWWGEVKWCLPPSGYPPLPPTTSHASPGSQKPWGSSGPPSPRDPSHQSPSQELSSKSRNSSSITHQWQWTKSLPSGTLYFSRRKRGKSNKQVTTDWVRWSGASICGFGVIPSIHAPPPTSQCLHRDGTSQVAQWQRICHCRRHRRCRFDPWIWKIPWRRK